MYTSVRDKQCRDTYKECREKILDEMKDHVQHNPSIFMTFIKTLNGLNRNDLADVIEKKYKGMSCIEYVECVLDCTRKKT